MKKIKLNMRLFVLILIGIISSQAFSATENSLTNFRFEAVSVIKSGGDTQSGVFSWIPSYLIDEKMSIKGNLGISAYKGSSGNSFVVGTLGGLFAYKFQPDMAIEVGLGQQIWSGDGSWFVAGGNFVWYPSVYILGFINSIVGGYSVIFQEKSTNEFRIGIGFDLDSIYSVWNQGDANDKK